MSGLSGLSVHFSIHPLPLYMWMDRNYLMYILYDDGGR